ncbi:MAG: CHAT domain-containing protein [Rhodospirillales bacterium]|nr:CHAT domain-containing protein [Rhodospirillales bacterium]
MAPAQPFVLACEDYQNAQHWRWVLRDGGGNFLADHDVHLDPACPEYDGLIDLRGYLGRHAAPDRWHTDHARLLEDFGRWLGANVLGKAIGDKLLAPRVPLTVRVEVPAPAAGLLTIPLELAHAGGEPLALGEISLVFTVTGEGGGIAPEPVGERLRMLALFSLPTQATALALRRERHALTRLISEIAQTRGAAIELRVLQYGASRSALKAALEEADGWDLIHFSGHGERSVLLLEQDDGSNDIITTEALLELLAPARGRLKLATLSACWSAAATIAETRAWLGLPAAATPEAREAPAAGTGSDTVLPSLARALANELGCAVLAMRYPVGDQFAIDLAAGLFRHLFEKRQPLPRALAMALPAALTGAAPLSVATPALFGAAALALKLAPPAQQAEPPLYTEMSAFPDEPERFVGRTGALARATRALAPNSGQAGVLFCGMAGGGKTAAALELAYRYQPSPLQPPSRFRHFVWYKAPDQRADGEGADIGRALIDLALAMEAQIAGWQMVHLVGSDQHFATLLPRLTALCRQRSILFVLDNLESLLTADGRWRDQRWAKLIATLATAGGFSRLVLTSRLRPAELPASLHIEAVHALPLDEALLLARELPNLGPLLTAGVDGDTAAGRALVHRVLEIVQGHPKLIELADRLAANPDALRRQLAGSATLWAAGDASRLGAFFAKGEAAVADDGYLAVLAGWTRSIAATLPEAAARLFEAVCGLEDGDRREDLLGLAWPKLWQALGQAGDAPALDTLITALAACGLIAVEEREGQPATFRLHPGVAAAGKPTAERQEKLDRVLAGIYRAIVAHALEQEGAGAGPAIVAHGLAAAPYLARLHAWDGLASILQQVIKRDQSPATLALALPPLRLAAAHSGALAARGVLSRALYMAGCIGEADEQMRALIADAEAAGAFEQASVAAGDLFNLLLTSGRAREALELVAREKEFTTRAGLGPWTIIADDGQRLQALNALGRWEDVLKEVAALLTRMDALPESGTGAETAIPWDVREVILDIGHEAALRLERWQECLDLSEAIVASKAARGAHALEIARTRFNDCGPLVGLGRYGDAQALLDACRRTFEAEGDVRMLGMVFVALADLEDECGHHHQALAHGHTAIRYTYLGGDPDDVAISHFNLASAVTCTAAPAQAILAHRLAATLICLQTGDGKLAQFVAALASDRARFPDAPPPATFAALCAEVEQVEGVHFAQLFARLPAPFASGDAALAHVLALTTRSPDEA